MKKLITFILLSVFIAGCSSVMLTGRRQLNLVSDSEVNQMSFTAYKQLIDSVPLSTNATNVAMVKRVGSRIAAAVETYMKNNGYESQVSNFAWEYNLVKSTEANAFCMPGGKVVVYEGILPITQNEAGLAVVLGHEIAHAVARHSSERLSQQMIAQYGSSILGAAISTKSTALQTGIGALYGIGTNLTLLKYSRNQESEADHLGLIFMSMAGYNPNQAIPFWERMAANSGKASTLDFLSTHPSDATRIADIKKELPEAEKYYSAAK